MKKIKLFSLLSLLLAFANPVFAGIEAAYYEVPTSQAQLKSSSQFVIKKLSVKQSTDGQTSIEYQVPELLTGVDNTIEFAGNLNENGGILTSDHGVLNCLANTQKMMCSVSYQNLDFDSEKAKQLMMREFQGDELMNRMRIQEKFSTDPIGIIHIIYEKY